MHLIQVEKWKKVQKVPKRSPGARGGSVHKHMKELLSSSNEAEIERDHDFEVEEEADHPLHLVDMFRDVKEFVIENNNDVEGAKGTKMAKIA